MKQQLQQLTAFIIMSICILALIMLAGLMGEKSINLLQFAGGLGITATTLVLDVVWINRHFVDGEWS